MSHDFPSMLVVQQRFESTPPVDFEAVVSSGFGSIKPRLKPGMSVAVGVGSRGISNLSNIVSLVIDELKKAGTNPFIIPAMGSHGGATPEGQLALLAGYGVTEGSMGVPIRSSMEVAPLGVSAAGQEVHWSREAIAADGVFVINRVKPHTDFNGVMGSGLTKMLVVGLGKHTGASAYHAGALTLGYEESLEDLARVIFDKAPILGGVALVDNATHSIARLEVVPAEDISAREPELCTEAHRLMPVLPFDEIDLLIVDQMGKNISGTGMDTNVICRGVHGFHLTPGQSPDKPFIWRIFVRGLTPETHGNAIGIGMAEATTSRLIAEVDAEAMRTNAITARSVQCSKLPMDFETDAVAIRAMLASLPDPDSAKARIVRIRDTLSLGRIEVSSALEDEVTGHTSLEALGQAAPMAFDDRGNLKPLGQA